MASALSNKHKLWLKVTEFTDSFFLKKKNGGEDDGSPSVTRHTPALIFPFLIFIQQANSEAKLPDVFGGDKAFSIGGLLIMLKDALCGGLNSEIKPKTETFVWLVVVPAGKTCL